MTYFFADDTQYMRKMVQLISRCMDIMDQSASQPVSQSVRLSLADRLNFINDLFRFRRYKNIRRMD